MDVVVGAYDALLPRSTARATVGTARGEVAHWVRHGAFELGLWLLELVTSCTRGGGLGNGVPVLTCGGGCFGAQAFEVPPKPDSLSDELVLAVAMGTA